MTLRSIITVILFPGINAPLEPVHCDVLQEMPVNTALNPYRISVESFIRWNFFQYITTYKLILWHMHINLYFLPLVSIYEFVNQGASLDQMDKLSRQIVRINPNLRYNLICFQNLSNYLLVHCVHGFPTPPQF